MTNDFFDISPKLSTLDAKAVELCKTRFAEIDETAAHNQQKVLRAFMDNRVSAPCFMGSTGYGYGDTGRDTLDSVFAAVCGADSALYRAQFMSGTHALTVMLFGLLRPGDTLLCVTGEPYDTLHGVIGLGDSDNSGSLADFGVRYKQVELRDGRPDLEAIKDAAAQAKVVYIQRSRGYTLRRALSLCDISDISNAAKSANPGVLVITDNCYGEFTQKREPTQCGADLMAGSLLKNPGAGIAETGGYIAGRRDLVELCAKRLTSPSLGSEIGCWPQGLRSLYLGLYLAPMIVREALKSSAYCAALFGLLGYETLPRFDEAQNDIVTSVQLGNAENLVAFCRGIQACSPVDSFASPEGAPMPGYDCDVVMASGSFTNGSSIELSADAPIREPYSVYAQGGLSFEASRIAYLEAAKRIMKG